MSHRPIIMVSGPMTGIPDMNYPAFNKVTSRLRTAGFAVENPAENHAPSNAPTWADWMRLSLAQMMRCDAVVMLPGWWRSKGARIEWLMAKLLCIAVFYPSEIDALASMLDDVPSELMGER